MMRTTAYPDGTRVGAAKLDRVDHDSARGRDRDCGRRRDQRGTVVGREARINLRVLSANARDRERREEEPAQNPDRQLREHHGRGPAVERIKEAIHGVLPVG